MAFVVNRKVGKAVVRNRIRRRLREALRLMLRTDEGAATAGVAMPEGAVSPTPVPVKGSGPDGRWPASFEALIIVRPSATEASYQDLADGLRLALDRASASDRVAAPARAAPDRAGRENAPAHGRKPAGREPRS